MLAKRGFDARSLAGGMKAWSLAWNAADVRVTDPSVQVVQVRRTGKGCCAASTTSAGCGQLFLPAKDQQRSGAHHRAHSVVVVGRWVAGERDVSARAPAGAE
ncbi:MAG: hypothetical protein ACRD3J_03160, partial [Thermoanaerobaculia bacterium]